MNTKCSTVRLALFTLCALAGPAHTILAAPVTVQLAQDGQALPPVVVASNASERVQRAAKDLAGYLGKITGGKFEVTTGPGTNGLVVGLPAQFPALPFTNQWTKPAIGEREDYLIRTHAGGAYLLGATEMGVEHAVWDFLYRVGYRQFFPGEHWEVIPRLPDLRAAIDARESPSYRVRRIWYGFGTWDYNAEPYRQWCARNRQGGVIRLNTGHSYGGIIHANQKAFDEHPEYFALVKGERRPNKDGKFCIANPALRRLVVEYELSKFGSEPDLDSVSLDPSDGGGWCECDACAKLGSVTDRVLLLANEVAVGVDAKFPDKFVGMYAYNFHSPPPHLRVDPHVIVSIATAFIKGGLSLDDLITGWSKQGATLGIREYYSVNTWDRDQPGQARGSNLDYLRRTIPEFYAKGARYLSAESSDNWGPNGLGYYLAARMLWDVREAQQTEGLVEDFLTRAFGPAKEPMREFYRQLDGSKPHPVPDDQLGRMFRALQQARALAPAADIRARIDDLVLYARYASLYHRYAKAKGEARQEAFEALIRHTYRMRTTMLVHTRALYRDLDHRDKAVKIPDGCEWNVTEDKNPWKTSAPFTAEEIAAYVADGVRMHPLTEMDFQPVAFSMDLVPASARLKFREMTAGNLDAGRGRQTLYAFIRAAPTNLELQVAGGLIAHYRDRGNVKIELWKIGGASQTGEHETLAASDRSVPPDGAEHTVKLPVNEPGLYRISLSDGMDSTRVDWKPGQPMAVVSTTDEPMNKHYGQWTLYFYVPKGTKVVGLFGGVHGEVRDSENRPRLSLDGREPNYFSVPVPAGQDGKLWSMSHGHGDVRLLTVPSCFARTPQELLLPREVVEQDAE